MKNSIKKFIIKHPSSMSFVLGSLILILHWGCGLMKDRLLVNANLCNKYNECSAKYYSDYGKYVCFNSYHNALNATGDIVIWALETDDCFVDANQINESTFNTCKKSEFKMDQHSCTQPLACSSPENKDEKCNNEKCTVFANMDRYNAYHDFNSSFLPPLEREKKLEDTIKEITKNIDCKKKCNSKIKIKQDKCIKKCKSNTYITTKYKQIQEKCFWYQLNNNTTLLVFIEKLSTFVKDTGWFLLMMSVISALVQFLDQTLGRFLKVEVYKKIRKQIFELIDEIRGVNNPEAEIGIAKSKFTETISKALLPVATTVALSVTIHQTIVIKSDIDEARQIEKVSKHKIELMVKMAPAIGKALPPKPCNYARNKIKCGEDLAKLRLLIKRKKELFIQLKDSMPNDPETEKVLTYEISFINRQIKTIASEHNIRSFNVDEFSLNIEELKKLNEIFEILKRKQNNVDQAILTTSLALEKISGLLKEQTSFNHNSNEILIQLTDTSAEHGMGSHLDKRYSSSIVAPVNFYKNRALYTLAASIEANEVKMVESILKRTTDLSNAKIKLLDDNGIEHDQNILWLALEVAYHHERPYIIANKICKKVKSGAKAVEVIKGFRRKHTGKRTKFSFSKQECLFQPDDYQKKIEKEEMQKKAKQKEIERRRLEKENKNN